MQNCLDNKKLDYSGCKKFLEATIDRIILKSVRNNKFTPKTNSAIEFLFGNGFSTFVQEYYPELDVDELRVGIFRRIVEE